MHTGYKVLFIVFICGSQLSFAGDAKVAPFGEYSNMKATESDHCDGYQMSVWQHGESIVGFLRHSEQLCGDSPAGLLEDVLYNQRTGSISFSSMISTGCDFHDNKECVPLVDLVKFSGELTKTHIAGTMTWYDQRHGGIRKQENVILKQQAESYIRSHDSLADWKSQFKGVFNRIPLK